MTETIVAIATPNGTGALGIVRLSGEEAVSIVSKFFQSAPSLEKTDPWKAVFGKIVSPLSVVDWAVAIKYVAPKSFTGEDMIEIITHGAPVILREVIRLAIHCGAREALPGEFTQRAYLNGKLDLVQAEAICGMIRSQSVKMAQRQAHVIAGNLSEKLGGIRSRLLEILAGLDVLIDHPDEPEVTQDFRPESLTRDIETVHDQIQELTATFKNSYKIREGICIAIVGAPNAGKSTLFNCFVSRDRAIVSEVAGTTRDTLEEFLEIDGLLVKAIDTAGIHATRDALVQAGIARTRAAVNRADYVFWVIDGTIEITGDTKEFLDMIQDKPTIILWNKKDLPGFKTRLLPINGSFHKIGEVELAAATGLGIEALRLLLTEHLQDRFESQEPVGLWEERQLELAQEAAKNLKGALARAKEEFWDLASAEVREAASHIGLILGKGQITDDLLRKIFSKFCIGK